MEDLKEKTEAIRIRITLCEPDENVIACISDIDLLKKLRPEKENEHAAEITLNPGDFVSYNGFEYRISDVKIRYYNTTRDLEKFGINKCGMGMEAPYNFQIVYMVDRLT